MSSLRRRIVRHAGSLFIAAVVLVPLFLGGHRHDTDLSAASTACGICLATCHSPAVTAPPLPQLAPTLYRLAVSSPRPDAPGQTYRPFKAGRAPPRDTTPQVV